MGLPVVPGDWGEGDEDSDSVQIPLLLIAARGTSLEFYVQRLVQALQVNKQVPQDWSPLYFQQCRPTERTHVSNYLLTSHSLHIFPFQWDAGATPLPRPRGRKTALQSSTKPAWQAQDARSQQPFLLDFLLTGILSLFCLTGAFLLWAFPSFFSLDQVLESWVSRELVHILIVCDSWEHLHFLTHSGQKDINS